LDIIVHSPLAFDEGANSLVESTLAFEKGKAPVVCATEGLLESDSLLVDLVI
jgi:hypothetical protein